MGRDRRSSDVNGKRRSVSSDSIVEKRPHHERVPLQDLVGKSRELATAAVGALSWDLVVGMLPDYLKVDWLFSYIIIFFSSALKKKLLN